MPTMWFPLPVPKVGLKENDVDFSFSDTYYPVSFEGARFCEIRVWSFFKSVNSDMEKYLDYASGRP